MSVSGKARGRWARGKGDDGGEASPRCRAPGGFPRHITHRLRTETVPLGSEHVGHRCVSPPAPRGGPPRPEQVAPGLGRDTIPASSSQRNRPSSGKAPPTPRRGSSGYPRSGLPCSEDAAGAPSAGATPDHNGRWPRRREPRRKHPPWGQTRPRARHTPRWALPATAQARNLLSVGPG